MLDLAMWNRAIVSNFVEANFMLILKTVSEMRISFLNRCNITFTGILNKWHEMAAQKVFLFERWMRWWLDHWSRFFKREWEQCLLIFFFFPDRNPWAFFFLSNAMLSSVFFHISCATSETLEQLSKSAVGTQNWTGFCQKLESKHSLLACIDWLFELYALIELRSYKNRQHALII